MLYGIDFRSMHTAIHGLFVFKTEDQAVNALNKLGDLEHVTDRIDDEEERARIYELIIQGIYGYPFDVIDEIDHREIQKIMEFYDESDLTIINEVAVDIY